MARLRVHNFSVSLDGYGAGPDQSLENPLGVGGEALHEWFVPDAHLPGDVRQGRRHDRRRRRFRRARLRRTSAPGSSAATCSARCAGRGRTTRWKGWWGDEPAVPRAGVRAHASRARADRDGGRHDVPLRHRRHPRRARARAKAAAGGKDVGSAAAPRRSGSTCAPAWSTRCTWPSRRCCSARASSCSPASTCRRSAIAASSTWRPPGRRTSC